MRERAGVSADGSEGEGLFMEKEKPGAVIRAGLLHGMMEQVG
jgi:hypothetical protein